MKRKINIDTDDIDLSTDINELRVTWIDKDGTVLYDNDAAAKARQDFTANVSHELKTPLTAISGYAQLLESEMVGAEQQKHFYQEIRKNADRLLALINDIIKSLRTLHKMQSGIITPVAR